MTECAPLILASASARRKEILEAHGHSFVIIPSDANESLPDDADFTPEETTIYLAELKAQAVFSGLIPEDWPQGCIILAVDTIVYKDSIIGKPVDEADALRILRTLRNTTHQVISGVCILKTECRGGTNNTECRDGNLPPIRFLETTETIKFADTTTVRFGDYTDEEILAYIRENPPYDKSGSYAIQSSWGRHVIFIAGDIENVIGLPYPKIASYIKNFEL